MKTYVWNGIEVKLTGRKASKDVVTIKNRQPVTTTDTVYEIQPVFNFLAGFTRWVKKTELYGVDND